MAFQLSIKEYEKVTEQSLQMYQLSSGVGLFSWLENIVVQWANEEPEKEFNGEDSFQWIRRCPYGGDALQFTNYVGLIPVELGSLIEIFPKIRLSPQQEDDRQVLFQMVCALLEDVRHIQFEEESLQTQKETTLYESLTELFLHDVSCLVRHGVARTYINLEGNLPYLKGRLLFGDQIKKTAGLMNSFYTQHDEFLPNRLENRVIKADLLTIKKYFLNPRHLKITNELLSAFEGVSPNVYLDEIKRTYCDREMQYYENALRWSEFILRNLSPIFLKTERHSLRTPCLLFPMHRLFEAFVFKCLKGQNNGLKFESQKALHYLFVNDLQTQQFKNQSLRPDIVIKDNDKVVAIMDTKWKKIATKDLNISPADLYQMYVYGKKYFGKKSGVIFLVFPKNEDFKEIIGPFLFDNEPKLNLYIVPFDSEKKDLSLGGSSLLEIIETTSMFDKITG